LSHGTTAEKIFVEQYVDPVLSSNHFRVLDLGLDAYRMTLLYDKKDMHSNLHRCNVPLSAMFFHHRFHRQLLAKFILSKALQDSNMISINSHETDFHDEFVLGSHPYSEQKTITAQQLEKNYVLHQRFTNDDWILDSDLQSLYDDNPIKTVAHPMINKDFEGYYHEFLQEGYVNIVNETVFDYSVAKITEKIIYPILIKRPFLLIGSAGSLEYFRSMGYKTFNTVIDESYDTQSDPNKRLKMIFNQITKIADMSKARLDNLVKETEWICEHNYKVFCDSSVGDSFQKKIKKTIE
jgi:hypothetical protein